MAEQARGDGAGDAVNAASTMIAARDARCRSWVWACSGAWVRSSARARLAPVFVFSITRFGTRLARDGSDARTLMFRTRRSTFLGYYKEGRSRRGRDVLMEAELAAKSLDKLR